MGVLPGTLGPHDVATQEHAYRLLAGAIGCLLRQGIGVMRCKGWLLALAFGAF